MKILHLDSGREMRGGQWQVLRLHEALLHAGHESHLLAREGSPLFHAVVERKLPAEILRLGLLPRHYDIIHAHDARTHTHAALFARAPFVVSRRVAFPIRQSPLSRWKYGKPKRYLAVSRYVSRILIAANIDAARIDIVYDGVEVPQIPATGDAILTPYTLDSAKGMRLAEQAATIANVPLARSHHLEQDLVRARALLYLSQSEGLGSGILLAMAHGVSVIASDTGGIPELIEDGVTGTLVPNDAQTIANALRHINPAHGVAARERVQNRFTIRHMVEATLESYRKAIRD